MKAPARLAGRVTATSSLSNHPSAITPPRVSSGGDFSFERVGLKRQRCPSGVRPAAKLSQRGPDIPGTIISAQPRQGSKKCTQMQVRGMPRKRLPVLLRTLGERAYAADPFPLLMKMNRI